VSQASPGSRESDTRWIVGPRQKKGTQPESQVQYGGAACYWPFSFGFPAFFMYAMTYSTPMPHMRRNAMTHHRDKPRQNAINRKTTARKRWPN
jgi:hypothetical protein